MADVKFKYDLRVPSYRICNDMYGTVSIVLSNMRILTVTYCFTIVVAAGTGKDCFGGARLLYSKRGYGEPR